MQVNSSARPRGPRWPVCRWAVAASIALLAGTCGITATSQSATKAEWRQVGSDAGWSFYSPAAIVPPLTANTYDLPLVGYNTALVAAGEVVYLVEPHRVTALRQREERFGRYSVKWDLRTRPVPLQDAQLSPQRAVATERGVVIPLLAGASPGRREDVVAGLEAVTGKAWFELAAPGAEKVGVSLISTGELLVGHLTSKPGEREGWRLVGVDPDRGSVRWSVDGTFRHHGEIAGTEGWLFAQGEDALFTLEPVTHRQRGNRYARVGTPVLTGGGNLFLADYESAYRVVRCVDRAGQELWKWQAPAQVPLAVRATSPERVIVEGGGQLWALEARTGRLCWQRKAAVRARQPEYVLAGRGNPLDPFSFTWSARVVVGSVLYYTSSGTGKSFVDTLNAVDVRTGKLLWTSQYPASLETLIAHRGRLLLLARTPDSFRSQLIELTGSTPRR